MAGKHVAVFMFPGYGHVNPTLEISRLLIALGHRVSYVQDERLAGPVTAAGARMIPYTSRRARLAAGTGTVTGEEIAALGLTYLREQRDVILPLTLEAFGEDVPDLVLYDLESFFTARNAARRWGRPTVQVFPYIATNDRYSLNEEVFADAGESLEKSVELVAEFLTREGAAPEAVWPFLANHDERNLVLLPRELQPFGETFDDRYTFTGHSLPADRPGTGSWSRPAGDGHVVLITLGTEKNDRPDFFENCGAAFADGGWHLVVTVGPGNLPAGPVPAHMEMHEWLPFNAVLPHVSAVVFHAGMSTMLEALSFGKPLVVVTYTPEDRVNGRRVTELGLGVEVPGAQATPERLRAAVEHVVGDLDIHRRVARMRLNLLAAGGPARAARVLDGWLNEPFPTSGEHMSPTAPSGARESVGA
jgi:MGT family glycosyltransferase